MSTGELSRSISEVSEESGTSQHFATLIDIDDDAPSASRSRERLEVRSNPPAYEQNAEYDAFNFNEVHRENERLKGEIARLKQASNVNNDPAKWPVLHRIECVDRRVATYTDRPVIIEDDQDGHEHFDSRRRIPDERAWESAQKSKPFVVYKTYICRDMQHEQEYDPSTSSRHVAPHADSEEVKILSRDLRKALVHLFQYRPGLKIYWQDKVFEDNVLRAPYVFLYHFGADIQAFVRDCGRVKAELELLLEYLKEQAQFESLIAATTFSTGMVTQSLMPYLFAPLELLVVRVDDEPVVVTQTSLIDPGEDQPHDEESRQEWAVSADKIVFDGKFRRKNISVTVVAPVSSLSNEAFPIASLSVHPLRHGLPDQREKLLKRGGEFFKCRDHRYVTSVGNNESGEKELTEVRYMVDVQAYHLMHGDKKNKPAEVEQHSHAPVFEPIEDDEDTLVQMPAEVRGFRMSDKMWVNLLVRDINSVSWNKQAFQDLVIQKDAKELIEALVRNKINADQGIDFVDGKGTGLVVLLHGGPGTGKTLTAESVAEIAEKPLYRVTCGDIGTEPEQVEEYLESVFKLGRRWGCVVLLDEADVFLEERSHDNLARNALVSVFLRAIEYYDGILILTSNRVGRFDEAFRSRVQLALAYKSLDPEQRYRIWENFLRRLRSVNETMAIEEIESHIGELAKFEMNGRQIRNAINTARQLARFQERPMNLKHLKHVIQVSQRFDQYIDEIYGVDPEQIAREKAER